MATPTYQPHAQTSKAVAWYQPTLIQLPTPTKDLFLRYTDLKTEDAVKAHILAVREKAWQIHPYPCIGLFKFLNFSIHLSPIYPEILNRIRAGQTLLDLGCCLGQDLRKLAFDTGTSSNLIGADIEASFLQLGYELFQDRASLQAHFVTGSIFDEDFLATRKGSIDIIYLGSFLHLFNLAKQRVIVSRLEELLVPRAGSVVFGRHIAALEGGPFFMESLGWDMFRHSEVTIRELWGAGWEVHSQLEEYESATQESGNWQGDTTKQMTFWAIRR